MSGNDAVRGELFTMLCESNATDRVLDLVLAALDGGDTFDEVVAGEPIERPEVVASTGPVAGQTVEASGVFLSSITVEGFRGIGPASTLAFPPGPGLTIITGRNGSGKSSFAEALEVVLTGTAHRVCPFSGVEGRLAQHAVDYVGKHPVGCSSTRVAWRDGG